MKKKIFTTLRAMKHYYYFQLLSSEIEMGNRKEK